MRTKHWWVILLLCGLVLRAPGFEMARGAAAAPGADDPSPPSSPVKLIFIHHSCGSNWLNDSDGGLGIALRDANYFVSDTNYGWGPDNIGDRTDIGHWWEWFRGPSAITYTTALYTEYGQHASYSRLASDPGGENEIIMFKSCYPNSNLGGSLGDPIPPIDSNSLRGQSSGSTHHTVPNAQGIYIDLLSYFETHQDKLFIAVTAPPRVEGNITPTEAANARDFNDWLVNDWLSSYPHDNVAVFDFFNVLTSNGGSPSDNDLGDATGNHHRWWNDAVQHTHPVDNDYGAYADDHPNAAGNQKATGEFVELLNVYYHRWDGGAALTATLEITAPDASTTWPISSTQQIAWTATGVITRVNLSYSLGGGYRPITSNVANATGSNTYRWTTPITATTSARVRVESVLSPTTVYDVSEAFTLLDTAELTHTLHLPLLLKAPASQQPVTRLQPADLVYQGAFAYPAGDDWAYSGHALAYYPSGDPAGPSDGTPGSLYAAAHDQQDLVGEISIPVPVTTTAFSALPTASVLRPLADITGGWIDDCTYHAECIYREVDGLVYLPNIDKIAWNLRDWYNVAAYDQDSLGWSDLDMGGAQGVWHIGPRPSADDVFHNAKTCNYLFPAPTTFATQHLEGKWLIAGSTREAGALGGSQGPTLFALAPWEDGSPPTSGQTLDALALLYYPEIYPGCYDDPTQCHYPDYRAKDVWGGGAWVQTASKHAILVVGRKGLGDNCYGTPEDCGGDPCDPYKGYHAYPYQPQILFYDPDELRAVVEGTLDPWEVVPYAIHVPTIEAFDAACATLGAATYDPDRQLIYVTERTAGEFGETAVHVWTVG